MESKFGYRVKKEFMKIEDCPFKAGTPEHSGWVSQLITHQQTHMPTYIPAKEEADKRLAALKAKYVKPVILDPYIDWLVNGGEEPEQQDPIILDAYAKHIGRLGDINSTWQKTGLSVYDNSFYNQMPQIDDAPEWVTDETLYEILMNACRKNIEEIRQQQGYLFIAVHKPMSLNANNVLGNLTVSQVRVKYERWVR